MVIQHNISSLNSWRNTKINNNATTKNLEKLSSGFRVNRASDDAAGLAISEKMRGQIRGTMMGTQNVNMGINLVQTAEGGLHEAHAIMHRMRELAVQASNGTYVGEDREAIQHEIASLTSEINRLSSSTHYNTIQVLDGTITGDYEYHYGIKGPNTFTPTDPASITAGVAFSGPAVIDGGYATIDTQSHGSNDYPYNTYYSPYNATPSYSYMNNYSNLNELDAAKAFPKEGLFVIQVQTQEGKTVNAVLDFAKENADGDFSLADFEAYFAKKLKDVAEFKIDTAANGSIQIETTGAGGPKEKVEIGKTNLSNSELTAALGYAPTGVRYANSALFGTQANDSESTSSGIKSTAKLTTADLAVLKAAPANQFMDTIIPSLGKTLWEIMPDTLTINFEMRQHLGGSSSTTVGSQSLTKADSGAATYAAFRQDIQDLAPSSLFSSVDINNPPTYFVDRDGYAYIQIGTPASKAPAYSGSSYFCQPTLYPYNATSNIVLNTATGYGPGASDYAANSPYYSTVLSSITSEYSVSNPLPSYGTLSVTIGNIPDGAGVKQSSVTIDFSSQSFADKDALVQFIQDSLNANAPNPAPVFTHQDTARPYSSTTPVAQVYIDGSGKLVVRAEEREFTITIAEDGVDAPVYKKHSAIGVGTGLNNYLAVEDDFGNKDEIRIRPGTYDNIDEFISKNAANFKPKYLLEKSDDGKSLVIKTVGEGAEYTLNSISWRSDPATGINNANMSAAFAKLGFANSALNKILDGVTYPPEPEPSNALWIQSGANTGDGMFIAVPRLDAYDLGLMIKFYEHATSASYSGISTALGTNAYTTKPNVEPEPMGCSLDITTVEKANAAIPILDNAINIVSSERAQLGAAQNRLESMKRYNGIQEENLQAAESTIRDVDMAKEMMEFTKNNILVQASQSMLAQANQLPQGVLSLLR